jgi:hypothetical protein
MRFTRSSRCSSPLALSVAARYAGRRLDVRLCATSVVVLEGRAVVAQHTRSAHKGTEDLVLDHYLEVMTRKPGALAGATAVVRARAAGSFTPAHQRFWDGARKPSGTRAAPEPWSGSSCYTAPCQLRQ